MNKREEVLDDPDRKHIILPDLTKRVISTTHIKNAVRLVFIDGSFKKPKFLKKGLTDNQKLRLESLYMEKRGYLEVYSIC